MTRVAEIQETVINRLQSVIENEYDTGGVIPMAIASQKDELNPRVSVSVEIIETNNLNKVKEADVSVRVVIDANPRFVERNGTLELTELQDRVVDNLTDHPSISTQENRTIDTTADGVDSSASVEYSDEVERYMCVIQFRFRNYEHAGNF